MYILLIRYIICTFLIFHKVSTIFEEGGGRMVGVLHYFILHLAFINLCPRLPHFLSASYAPDAEGPIFSEMSDFEQTKL